jgi:hypothetical protein
VPLGEHKCHQHIGNHDEQHKHREELQGMCEFGCEELGTYIAVDKMLQLQVLVEPQEAEWGRKEC